MQTDPLRRAYGNQKGCAKERGIEFNLSFEEWLDLWTKSGKLSQRGRRRGQYVMSRYQDQGPYSLGNIEIKECGDNCGEANRGKPSIMSCRPKTSSHRRNISLGQLGRVVSPETRARISAAKRRRA